MNYAIKKERGLTKKGVLKKVQGKIFVTAGNEFNPPRWVYVKWFNNFNLLVCEVLNTGLTCFCAPSDLLENIDYQEFEEMNLKWEIENSERVKKRFESDLADLMGVKNKT